MIAFVGTPPFFRIVLWVAMATMHFHIAKIGLVFFGTFFSHSGIPGNNLAPMKIVLGCNVGQIGCRGSRISSWISLVYDQFWINAKADDPIRRSKGTY